MIDESGQSSGFGVVPMNDTITAIKKALEGVTPGPWHAGHLGGEGKCQCSSILSEGISGDICTIHVNNGKRIGEGGNDAPPLSEAIANMHYIAAVNPDAISELLYTLESWQRENEASEATATRYANEIIELRGELAKTASLLVVQADRADAAEAELDSRTRALDEAEAGIKRLRETLHPFAEAADYYSTGVHRTPAPDALPCGPALIVAHLRAARAALSSTGDTHGN